MTARVVVLSLLLALVGAAPAQAATATAGEVVFQGEAELPQFPCPPPPPFGDGPCEGDFRGEWVGQVAGVSGTAPFEATWRTTQEQGVEATFSYFEHLCGGGGLATLQGSAVGSGFAEAVPGQIQGFWHIAGEDFPRNIIGVRLDFEFEWARFLTTAIMLLTPTTLRVDVAGLGMQTIATGDQVAVAVFVPTEEDEFTGVPACDNPVTNVKGQIAGTVPLASAAVPGQVAGTGATVPLPEFCAGESCESLAFTCVGAAYPHAVEVEIPGRDGNDGGCVLRDASGVHAAAPGVRAPGPVAATAGWDLFILHHSIDGPLELCWHVRGFFADGTTSETRGCKTVWEP